LLEVKPNKKKKGGDKTITAAARTAIVAAQRARWAKIMAKK
jgi:hypothetical protein